MGFFNLNCRGCGGCGGGDSIFDSESGSDSVLVPDIDTEADTDSGCEFISRS